MKRHWKLSLCTLAASGAIATGCLCGDEAKPQEPAQSMEPEILAYLENQDLAKFENNPWLTVKSQGTWKGNGMPEIPFTKRALSGYWCANKLPCHIEADLGKPFKVEAIYVEDPTWQDFGAGRYEVLVYDDAKGGFIPTEPPCEYVLKNKSQKGHRRIFTFKPVVTSKIRLVGYEGRGARPEIFYIKKISVFSKMSDALAFEKDILSATYEKPKKSAWDGKWIWTPDFNCKAPEFKREFEVEGEIESAKLQGNAKNTVEVKINGKRVYAGNGEPSFIVDVKDCIKAGANSIDATVYNHAWPGGLMLELCVKGKDGAKNVIVSDDNWMARAKNSQWAQAAILPQDVSGRWSSKPVEDFKRRDIGGLVKAELPGSAAAGDECKVRLVMDLRERAGDKDISVELLDAQGRAAFEANATADKPIGQWGTGRREVELRFTPSRYLTPGEYAVKLKVKDVELSGKCVEGRIGKLKVAPPSKAVGNVDVKVQGVNGQPSLFIDGKSVHPMFYLYRTDREQRLLSGAGIHLYAVQTPETRVFWKAYGEYDLGSYERTLRDILSADPQAYIMVDLVINPNVPWWLKMHPDDNCLLSDGKPCSDSHGRWMKTDSFGSETGLQDSVRIVRDVVSHFESSPFRERIIGYRLYKAIGYEWYAWYRSAPPFPDHSPAMRGAFQRYLQGKYGNAEALRKSWGQDIQGFDSVDVPSDKQMTETGLGVFRDLKKEQQVADYFESVAAVNERYIEETLKAGRAACGGRKILGLFYGYTFELWGPRQVISGHLSLNKLLKSGTADFLCAPHSYFRRYVGEPGAFFQPVDSISSKGILYFDDSDFRTHLSAEDFPHDHIPQDTLSVLWRHFGIMWQKGYAFQWHGFGEWFISPEICDAFAKMSKLGKAATAAEETTKTPLLVPEKDRIAIIISERAPFVMGMEMKKRLNYYLFPIQREVFPKIGAPFDMLLLEELLERKEFNYKAYVFLNAFSLSDEQRKVIKDKIAVNGNVLAWFYAPGIYNGQEFGESGMKDLTGFSLKMEHKEGPLQVMIDDVANPLTASCLKGEVFGNAGEPVWPRIYCDDKDAKALGVCPPENRVGLAVKDMGSWKSVFIAAPRAPASLFRGICRMAGVHLYSETDLTLYPNNRSILIYPDRYMETEISFPAKVRLFNVMDGKWAGEEFKDKYKFKLLTDKPYIYHIHYCFER